MSYRQLFFIFLKAGCAFGGGLGILSVLENEFVTKSKLVTRQEFLSMYGIGKIVPSGTVTALAVGFGHKYKKLLGSIVALAGLILPGFTLTILLAALYTVLHGTEFFELINVSILPAAVALIVLSALNLGRDTYKSPVLLLFVFGAFLATFVLKINPALVLMGGGILSMIIFSKIKEVPDVAA
jgi:chromate transporter